MNTEIMAARLKEARQKAGYSSAASAAAAFGWKEAGYRHHEGGVRAFDVSTAVRYAKAFKVNPGWLLGLDKIDAPRVEVPKRYDPDWLTVTGAVAAGVWREQTDWASEEQYAIEVGAPPFSGADRFAVRMDGRSMDKTIPPGSDLECLRTTFGRRAEPQLGDLVIVERGAHDLTEMTCKRLDKIGDDYVLRAESTLPEFQEPIMIGRPDADDWTDTSIRVIGIVIRSYQRHSRRF